MKKNTLLLFFLFYILNTSLTVGQNSPRTVYNINIDNAKNLGDIPLSNFFKSLKIIPLERVRRNSFLFVSKLYTCRDKIFVLSKFMGDNLFVFDQDGKYIRTISRKGNWPGEYAKLDDIVVDSLSNSVWLLDNPLDDSKSELHEYNYITGKYIKTIPLNEETEPLHLFKIGNELYGDIYYNYYKTGKSLSGKGCYLLRKIEMDTGNTTEYYLLASEYNKGRANKVLTDNHAFFPTSSEHCLFVQSCMDTIMSISSEGVQPYLAIKSNNFINTQTIQDYLDENRPEDPFYSYMLTKNLIYRIANLMENNGKIFFSYLQGYTTTNIYYDTQENQAYKYTGLNDLLFKEGQESSYLITSYLTTDSKGVYYVINADGFSMIKRYVEEGRLNPNFENIEELKNISEESSNPILLYYEFKD